MHFNPVELLIVCGLCGVPILVLICAVVIARNYRVKVERKKN